MTYPEHPFISDLSALSDTDIQSRITELHKKLSVIYRMNNPNTYVIEQIRMAINSYQTEYQSRQDRRRDEDKDGFNEIIDIS
jgi:hypothetical protein